MLKLKQLIRSDLFWSLAGGFALGAVAMVGLQPEETEFASYAQQAPANQMVQI